ncbi:MAG: hypothetical protein EOO74_01430 [Myxococcales bacterium]|nr:MAG: hypothetical protein EOO74_01430 [Myxococcales bacterium]
MKRATLWGLLAAGVLLTSTEAQAQDQFWLNDSRLSGGRGVQRDRLRYSGSLAASFGYDSNPFLRANTATEQRADAFRLMITPAFQIETRNIPGAARAPYSLTASASVSYIEFIKGPTTSDRVTDDLSGHRNLAVNGTLRLRIAPGARWSGDLYGGVVRSIQPSNLGDPDATFNRTTPTAGAGVTWSPGGGLFSWRLLGYGLTYTYFESDRFQRYNSFLHNISSEATWRFLPRTSLFASSQLGLIRYTATSTEQSSGDAVTTRAGINGLLTDRFGFLASVGWATTVFDSRAGAPRQDFDSLVAQAEVRFYLSAAQKNGDEVVHPTTLAFGYVRDWAQSYIGNYYGRDRGYSSLSYFFANRVRSMLQFSVARLGFPATNFDDGTQRNPAFNSVAINTGAFIEYIPTTHVGIFANVDYTGQITDTNLSIDRNNPGLVDALEYKRFTATLGLRYLL